MYVYDDHTYHALLKAYHQTNETSKEYKNGILISTEHALHENQLRQNELTSSLALYFLRQNRHRY